MNVWIVSFDESEDASDPTLSAYEAESDARYAVKQMLIDTAFDLTDDEMGLGDCSVMNYDPETGERVQIHVRHVRVHTPSVITSEVL